MVHALVADRIDGCGRMRRRLRASSVCVSVEDVLLVEVRNVVLRTENAGSVVVFLFSCAAAAECGCVLAGLRR